MKALYGEEKENSREILASALGETFEATKDNSAGTNI